MNVSLTELLPSIRQLPALEKVRLIRILAEELDTINDISPLQPDKLYYLRTPYNSFGVGRVLMTAMTETEEVSE